MEPLYFNINDIRSLTGLCKTTVYNRVNDGTFPRPVKIGARSFWKRDEFLSALEVLEANRPH
ncbi:MULTISPECIES: helix-turn-helix transcriptional regulator [unclassified Leisingera]|uniref:helix-turn-helix transcriptional regulator n=1 Tax=unclassified Leisingera TaxID=2614906 RepID=UPI0002F1B97B|nr:MULTISPECIES: AlpA family phage regulatory protein [unclassified Leisingera]KIC55089.1 hypothetical protein RA22_03260 [Leisingera sp. ANG-S]KID08396.1 hypothetical protein GC1_14675 [Leisingera sp. ANG1]